MNTGHLAANSKMLGKDPFSCIFINAVFQPKFAWSVNHQILFKNHFLISVQDDCFQQTWKTYTVCQWIHLWF